MIAERFSTSEIARVQVYGRMGNMVAKLKNISSTGGFLELINGDYVPKQGDFVHMTVNLHSMGRIHEVDAEVVWNDALGFGISFVKKDQLLSRMMSKGS
jgi:homogentisate 1,2-dioxygenase